MDVQRRNPHSEVKLGTHPPLLPLPSISDVSLSHLTRLQPFVSHHFNLGNEPGGRLQRMVRPREVIFLSSRA